MMAAVGKTITLALALLPFRGAWGALPAFPLSTKEVKIRMGYYTEGGKYLGGVPKYKEDDGIYQCSDLNYQPGTYNTASGRNATVCMSWATSNPDQNNTSVEDQPAVDRCICQEAVTTNAEYCAEWKCGIQDVGNLLTCPGDVTPCSLDYELTQNTAICACGTAEESGKFCAAWTCRGWNSDGVEELEEFQCVRDSPSGEYCDGWTSVIERPKEIQVSTCDCIGQWNGDSVCTYWECKERSMPVCSHANDPHMSWCNVGIAVGLWGLLGSIGAFFVASGLMRLVQDSCVNVFVLGAFLMVVFSVPVVIWGGQDAAVYVGIWWGAIILVGLAYGYWTKPV